MDTVVSGFKALGRQEDEVAAIRDALDTYLESIRRIAETRRQIAAQELAIVWQCRQETSCGKAALSSRSLPGAQKGPHRGEDRRRLVRQTSRVPADGVPA